MKVNAILTLVVASLASKVAAECFATKLGSPCCTETTEVVSVDKNGKWGMENGVKCGIEEINVSYPKLARSNKYTTDWSNYMDKIKITELCPLELVAEQEGIQYPTIERFNYYSTTTETDRPLIVLLPPYYSTAKKYPVVYLLHGIMGNGEFMLQEGFGTVTIPGNLFHLHKAKECIIVLPDQYAPAPGTEVEPALNEAYFAGYNNFINDLVNDIMPYMEQHYSIATGRENTAIIGYSFGGRNSLYIGYTRPDLFGYVGSFSPAPGLVPGDDFFTGHHTGLFQEDELRTDNPPIVTMLSCGTNDTIVFDFPKTYHEILTRNNQKHIWYEIQGHDHADNESLNSPLYNFFTSAFGILNNEPPNGNGHPNKTKTKKTKKTRKTKKTKNNKNN
eukprot:jgi/Orpsp1_1/1185493/evm.model.c7180000094057.2